tara:strand:+ start:136 stop:609 length:474 start_codon:yes stop_codon:yes gene_type:complete
MLIQFSEYLTIENIYLWTNFGVLPFWLMLIIIPNLGITRFLINSIILPLILAIAYVYVLYQTIMLKEPLLDLFKIYTSLDNLYALLSTETFLLIFWIHFVTLNLFVGSWMSRDAIKFNIKRSVVLIPLILVYFAGPVGIVLYWILRIFYAKKLGFHD